MDLTTSYMGLRLRNPLIASPSPLNGDLDTLRALEDHGAGAVVLPSIFEEQILAEREELERRTEVAASGSAEAQTYFAPSVGYGFGPDRYLEIIRRAKKALDIPVIASLNCVSSEGWREYASAVQQAGADGLELNVYFIPADLELSGRDVETRYLEIVSTVKSALEIPIAVKLGPYFSSTGAMARALSMAGANGLVLFNRFYQPDIDVRTLGVSMDLELSRSQEMRLPMVWIAILHGRISASIAASTGVQTAEDVYKYLLVGADAVMTTSSLLRHGVEHMRVLLDGLTALLEARGIDSLMHVRGRMSQKYLNDPATIDRAHYIQMLTGYRVHRPT